MTIVLGIETSCDETACSIVKDGKEILSNVIASQTDLHELYGGVVPELACRRHIRVILPVIEKAVAEAHLTLKDIDLIAVAKGPGLIGALLIGVHTAKALALSLNKPIVGVNHVEAHLYSAFMGESEIIPLPSLGLIVSGGHTALVLIPEIGRYQLIGQTGDDAVGEAFDKIATLLGLPYPGGPHVEILARQGDPRRYPFKAGMIKNRPFDFSFSGLKTNVMYTIKGQNASKDTPILINEEERKDIAASFQHAALSDIVKKACLATQAFGCQSIAVGGGVSQNGYLRALFSMALPHMPIFWPLPGLSQDNAAMIAALGFHLFSSQGSDALDNLHPIARIPFQKI